MMSFYDMPLADLDDIVFGGWDPISPNALEAARTAGVLNDADLNEIQRMRSVLCLKPGEQRSCIGCHEPRNLAPPALAGQNSARHGADARRGSPDPAAPPTAGFPRTEASPPRGLAALGRAPSRPQPPPWGTQILSYLRDIQPLLDARCVRCHAYDRLANGVILTGDLTDQFCVSYEELLPHLSVAISNRWDHPDDVLTRPPYTYGSQVSELTKILRSGHHGVQLTDEDWERLTTWIDDVATTGATISSCSGALLRAGARAVHALTIARALPHHGLNIV